MEGYDGKKEGMCACLILLWGKGQCHVQIELGPWSLCVVLHNVDEQLGYKQTGKWGNGSVVYSGDKSDLTWDYSGVKFFFQITVQWDVKFQILTSCQQLCETIGNPVIIQVGM